MASYSAGIQVDIGQIVAEESAGVDWSNKTPKTDGSGFNPTTSVYNTLLSVTGSGYLMNAYFTLGGSSEPSDVFAEVVIDGSTIFSVPFNEGELGKGRVSVNYDGSVSGRQISAGGIMRFDNSLEIRVRDPNVYGLEIGGGADYVLD